MQILKQWIRCWAVGALLAVNSGCDKPEIAEVLEDYCQFQKDCDYIYVNQDTQYHNLKTCDKFHKRLLEDVSEGKSSGCKDDVQSFFIDFMEAQMAFGCTADLVTSLNNSQETQASMDAMLTCVKESDSEITQGDLAKMGCTVLNTLEINLKALSKPVCQTILSNVLGDDNKATTYCALLQLMSDDMAASLCDQMVERLSSQSEQ